MLFSTLSYIVYYNLNNIFGHFSKYWTKISGGNKNYEGHLQLLGESDDLEKTTLKYFRYNFTINYSIFTSITNVENKFHGVH